MLRKCSSFAFAAIAPVVFAFVSVVTTLVVSSQVTRAQQAAQPAPAKAPAPEYKIPPEAAQKQNPVKSTPESLAKGKKFYNMECGLCHGEKGDSKGDMSEMKNITDFTNPDSLKGRSDGDLFYIIRKGKGEMPPEDAGRAKDDDVWSLVNYIRAFAKK